MNRLSNKIAAVVLAVLVAAGTQAMAREKTPKKKKNQDLSANPLANVNSKQPDKELFDKAMVALKKGRYDVARLDLQTMLNTYPDSEYKMRAKLAVGDSWFKEGGTAALTQAEAEYEDFITFFPDAPEAAEAQMKVGDIYYQQMEKPDRDYTNAEQAEKQYRKMLAMFPDSSLAPRAKQKLRDVQEVLAERETQIGVYYESRENFSAAIARLATVVDTYPVYSKSDLALLSIGDAYAGESRVILTVRGLSPAVRERLSAMYADKAAAAYSKVITRYPMAARVEDARDRLVAMNRPVPEPTAEAVAESKAEEDSRQPIRFTDNILGLIKRGPTVVEAVHVGEPSAQDPKRTLATDVNKDNLGMFNTANGKPAAQGEVITPTGVNEPPRSDAPSTAPVSTTPDGSGTSVGVSIVSAANATAGGDPNAVVKPVIPPTTAIPAAEGPTAAPDQINDIKSGQAQTTSAATNGKKKKAPKADLGDESSSRKKKKKGLGKINPF